MDIRIETISPNAATNYLNANRSNRKLRDGVVERYADDMKNGRWTECPEPISFYTDGDLADGQHRLWAIVEANIPITFPVARGLSREAGLNINTGLNRSLVDNARISGADKQVSNELIAVARAFEEGAKTNRAMSNSARLELVERHRDPCMWAISHGPRDKMLRNALTITALARAYANGIKPEKLARFAEVLSTGFMSGDNETAAIAMRNYLIERGSASSTTTLWRDTFLKAQNAIAYFANGKKLTVIKAVKEEAYPLPVKRASRK